MSLARLRPAKLHLLPGAPRGNPSVRAHQHLPNPHSTPWVRGHFSPLPTFDGKDVFLSREGTLRRAVLNDHDSDLQDGSPRWEDISPTRFTLRQTGLGSGGCTGAGEATHAMWIRRNRRGALGVTRKLNWSDQALGDTWESQPLPEKTDGARGRPGGNQLSAA